MKPCPHCKMVVADDAKVCTNPACGKPITAGAGVKQPPPPPGAGQRRTISPIAPPPTGAAPAASSFKPPHVVASPPAGSPRPPQPAAPKLPPPPGKVVVQAPPSVAGSLGANAAKRQANLAPPKLESAKPQANVAPPATSAPPKLPSALPAATPSAVTASKRPPKPGAVVMNKDSEMEAYLAALQRRVRSGKRRSWWLVIGTSLAVLLAAGAWLGWWMNSVLSYAELDSDVNIGWDPEQPDVLRIAFKPAGGGLIGISRQEEDRHTEILDEVPEDGADQEREFRLRGKSIQDGKRIQVTYREGWSLTTKDLIVPAAPAPKTLGDSIFSGEIVSAVDGQPVLGAEVRLSGTKLFAQTDAAGKFSVRDAPAGQQSFEITAPGFMDEDLQVQLTPSAATEQRVVISPGLKAGQIRVVLTWGDSPKDLDAHLEGPLPDGSRFHVFHKQKGDLKSKEFVSLDVDNREGKGPETITVLGVTPGTYKFFVHNASTEADPQSDPTGLALSGAQIKLYHGGQTYNYKVDGKTPGNVWQVCEIVVKPTGGGDVNEINRYEFTTEEEDSLYAKRTRGNRQQWIVQYGGTKASENAVNEGLAWLARHQAGDGRWGPDCLRQGHEDCQCERGRECSTPGGEYDFAHTGLTLLAFQAGGHYSFNNNKYSEHVRRGLDWLVDNQKPDGGLHHGSVESPDHYFMYEHGIAAFALNEAVAVARASRQEIDAKYREAAEKATRFIEYHQHRDGGWRYSKIQEEASDTSVSGWPMLALKSAKEAGISVGDGCLDRCVEFFKTCEVGDRGRTGYQGGGQITEATTGVGMLAHAFIKGTPDSQLIQDAAPYLADMASNRWGSGGGQPDYYLWYNCTLAMFQAGGDPWKKWNDAVRETIIRLQKNDPNSCERGSWDPNDQWGGQGGRIYSTALAVLALEVYYRYNSERAKVYLMAED